MKAMALFISRLLIGAIYVVAAAGKLYHPKAFFRAVADYQQLPGWLVPWVAAALPGVEMLAGAILVLGAFIALAGASRGLTMLMEAAAWIAAGLLMIFTVSLSINLLRGVDMDCGCFDILGSNLPLLGGSKVTWGTVWRDLIMLAIALPMLIRLPARKAAR